MAIVGRLAASNGRMALANWRHRALVMTLIRRDLRVRYLGSLLGKAWNLIHPLSMIAIYTLIFSQLMRARLGDAGANAPSGPLAYTIYLCAGLLPWNAFVESLNRGARVFLDHSHLIKKVTFPLEVLPVVASGVASASFGISISILLVLAFAGGQGLTWAILGVPVVLVLQFAFATGLGMALSIVNVYFRDTEQLLQIGLQVWFWMTPIVYVESAVPKILQPVFLVNPMYWFVEAYHRMIFWGTWPDASVLFVCVGLAAVFWVGGNAVFMRCRHGVVDEV